MPSKAACLFYKWQIDQEHRSVRERMERESAALQSLQRRLRALERTREVARSGAIDDAEDPSTYADDDQFILRPTLFGPAWAEAEAAAEAAAEAPPPAAGARVAARLDAARRTAAAAAAALFAGELPADVVDLVCDWAVGADACGDALCRCLRRTETYRLVRRSGARALATCIQCGRATAFAGGGWAVGRTVMLSMSAAHFVPGPGASLTVSAHGPTQCATARRDPDKRWHDFRAVPQTEVVRAGVAAYEVELLRVTDGEAAVGVCGDAARLNELEDWIPGLVPPSALFASPPPPQKNTPP